LELGVYTFADLMPDPRTGRAISLAQRLRDLMEEIELTDAVGLDVFGVGEHHRVDFAVSAPAVVLAAAAMRTRTIRLTSAVTVLSSGPGAGIPGFRHARPALRGICQNSEYSPAKQHRRGHKCGMTVKIEDPYSAHSTTASLFLGISMAHGNAASSTSW